MAKKNLTDLNMEELKSRKKTITAMVYTVSGIVVIYAVVIIYLMVSGKWNTNNALAVAPLAALGAVTASITAILGSINNEIKKREQIS